MLHNVFEAAPLMIMAIACLATAIKREKRARAERRMSNSLRMAIGGRHVL